MDVRKYGGHLADFMDADDRVILTSTKKDNCLREMNFTKRSYLTIYDGHTDQVVSLAVHRESRCFLTGSKDKSVGLWDFRSPFPQSFESRYSDAPLVAFGPHGSMFVVGLPDAILLYDLRGLGSGPFNEFKLNRDDTNWTNIKMSPNGDYILMSSSSAKIRLIDGILGHHKRNFEGMQCAQFACVNTFFNAFTAHNVYVWFRTLLQACTRCISFCPHSVQRNTAHMPIDASFTPNGEYILTGSSDGVVNVIRTNSADGSGDIKVAAIPSHINEPITSVEFNPKYTMLATASSSSTLWIPKTN